MPYVQSRRPYTGTKFGVNDSIFPSGQWTVQGREYPFSRSGVDFPGFEDTYSFRSNSPLLPSESKVMTGEEMKRAILRGDELQIDPAHAGGIAPTGEKIRRDGVLDSTWDQGHEFWTQKRWRQLYGPLKVSTHGPTVYEGAYFVTPYQVGTEYGVPYAAPLSAASRSELNALGNRAVSQSAPTAPESNLANFVGELTQLPSLPALKTLRGGLNPQNLGSEYLNVVFGWKPLISDIKSLCRAVIRSREIVEQYKRDADRVVRRRRTLVNEEVKTQVSQNTQLRMNIPTLLGLNGYNNGMFFASSYWGLTLDKTVESVWFSGAFSYFLQETDTFLGALSAYEQLANKVLGTRLDADVLWELTPWSWLIDWFLDLSSFVGRINRLASDNLVLRYGYVMRERRTERSFILPNILTKQGQTVPSPMTTYHAYSAERVRSTPFGFGLDVNALSAQRWAILAALGMTKSPRGLRQS